MKNIKNYILPFGLSILTACASSPTSSPKLNDFTDNNALGKGSVIFCKHHRKLTNAGESKPEAIDVLSILAAGRRVMDQFSMYFIVNDGEKLTPIFYSQSGDYNCGIVNLEYGKYKVVVAAANVSNFAVMTGKPLSTEVEISQGTPKVYVAGYTAIPPFSMTWDIKNVSPSQALYTECNALREQSLTIKEKNEILRQKYGTTSDGLACSAILSAQETSEIPSIAKNWVSKKESRILKGI